MAWGTQTLYCPARKKAWSAGMHYAARHPLQAPPNPHRLRHSMEMATNLTSDL